MSKRKYTPKPAVTAEQVTPASKPTDPLLDEVLDVIVKLFDSPTTHIMAEGENILTVARRYLPEGVTRSEYANRLVKSNPSFAVGRVISLG
jgi:Tfp pilus assembly protein FimV